MPRNNAPIQQQFLLSTGKPQPIWIKWFSLISSSVKYIRRDGSIEPVSLADADAENNSIYFSTDANKLVYKDSGGVVNNLY